jgi:hypothetical protein
MQQEAAAQQQPLLDPQRLAAMLAQCAPAQSADPSRLGGIAASPRDRDGDTVMTDPVGSPLSCHAASLAGAGVHPAEAGQLAAQGQPLLQDLPSAGSAAAAAAQIADLRGQLQAAGAVAQEHEAKVGVPCLPLAPCCTCMQRPCFM